MTMRYLKQSFYFIKKYNTVPVAKRFPIYAFHDVNTYDEAAVVLFHCKKCKTFGINNLPPYGIHKRRSVLSYFESCGCYFNNGRIQNMGREVSKKLFKKTATRKINKILEYQRYMIAYAE